MKSFATKWFDPYVLALLLTLAAGLVIPISQAGISILDGAVRVAIAALFLVYGMRMSVQEIVSGLRNIRLQGAVLASTFVVFPLLGLLLFWATNPLLGESLATGIFFLCLLPSTVQSSVVLIAVAKGNVAGGICAATLSNVLGIIITPLLVFLFLGLGGGNIPIEGIYGVLVNLLAPFLIGLILQRWVGAWIRAQKRLTTGLDRGTILLVVFTAAAGASGLLEVRGGVVALLIVLCALLLTAVSCINWWGGAALGLNRQDRVVLLMAGSVKSLATGLPMAAIILPPSIAAAVVIPVIVYHQLQLIAGAVIARRLGQGGESREPAGASTT